MKRFNKRGDGGVSFGFIILLIILVLVAALLGWWLSNAFKPEDFDYTSCQTSVNLRAAELLGVHPEKAFQFPLMCKTQNIVVKTSNEEEIQKTIAKQMYYCWEMLGRGEKDFFDESRMLGVGVEKASCVICSTIKFDEKVQQKISQVDIFPYLNEQYIPNPNHDPTRNLTYIMYFTDNPQAKLTTELQGAYDPISTSEQLAIVFMGIKGDSIGNAVKEWGATSIGLWVGGGVAASQLGILGKVLSAAAKNPETALLVIGITEAVLGGTRAVFYGINTHAANIHCSTTAGKGPGCYALILAPLEQENLTKICQNIESIP
ncbi:MAG: hypothetical protein NTX24_04490 [Candidatus Pacearchaeota archaeon]|nr:hypothetical protein [Candidatus Pacearchaeota archaeon]